jgi:hypothetical protein
MKVGGVNRFAYNAQAVTDGQEGVIVACEADRQETDAGQLVPMIEQARENLGAASVDTLTLADTGYGAGADLQAAREKQLPVLVPPAEGKPAHDNPYASLHFYYDPQARTVTCPEHRPLDYEGHTDKAGQRVERYRCHCPDCPRASAMHPRSQRPADRSLASHRSGASPASRIANPVGASRLSAPQPTDRTTLWANQATRRFSTLDGMGVGSRANPMGLALCDTEPANPLQKMATRPSGEPENNGGDDGEGGKTRNFPGTPPFSSPASAGHRQASHRARGPMHSYTQRHK